MSLQLLSSVSESPRAPSPWDDLIRNSTPPTASPSPSPALVPVPVTDDIEEIVMARRVPKLVPEVEKGNVEYKLKLLNPSPARFARLVTQLKWRLFEGQGQAYYEIGVADSGLLVGLTKSELEASLQTLEEMAGDIGASVIVVKEVVVPDTLVRLAERTVARYGRRTVEELDGDDDDGSCSLGAWDRRPTRALLPASLSSVASVSSLDTGTDTDAPYTDEDPAPTTIYSAVDFDLAVFDDLEDTDPSDIGLFLFDPEPAPEIRLSPADTPSLTLQDTEPSSEAFPPPASSLVDLSIASVFKPRPGRRRPANIGFNGRDRRQAKCDKREKKKDKFVEWKLNPLSQNIGSRGAEQLDANNATVDGDKSSKAEQRRINRDLRRAEKRNALISQANVAVGAKHPFDNARVGEDAAADLAHRLDGLHVSLAPADSPLPAPADIVVTTPGTITDELSLNPGSTKSLVSGQEDASENEHEPRLIVEALVVRKLSIDEATYGDFAFDFEVE